MLISCIVFICNDYKIKASQVHTVACAGNFNARIRRVHRLEKHLFTSNKHKNVSSPHLTADLFTHYEVFPVLIQTLTEGHGCSSDVGTAVQF